MCIENRTGETGVVIPARKSRVFKKENGYWYYSTREGMEFGPFDSEEKALQNVDDFIENFIDKIEDTVLKKISECYG